MANKMDDLTRDALAASRCGMSYGRYKGLQHEIAERKGRPAPVIKQEETPPAHKEFNLVCVQCGKHYVGRHPRRKYCSDVCKNKHDQALYRERHPKNEKEAQSNGNI